MILRPYQVAALDDIWTALHVDHNALLSAPCGSGKTIVASTLIKRLLAENPQFRVLVLVDAEILVHQFREKLIKVAPELALHIGVCCASVSSDKQTHRRITIASRQTLINQLGRFEPVQLIIVDEVHTMSVPHEDDDPDQYGIIIQTLRQYNPKTRLWGITASPFRLNSGYIYGDKNSKGCRPYFPELTHKILISELQAAGYLAPLVGKTILSDGLEASLKNVPLIGGEYNIGVISNIMSYGVHIKSAVEAWKEFASDRKKTIVFATTIEHCEKLEEAFNAEGISALSIHSGLDDLENYARMNALKNGDAKVFCSVAKLTKGLDIVDIDAILMCRPTKSTALYLQCLGRAARPYQGKKDALILDLVGNNAEHGTDLDRLKVRYRLTAGGDGKPVVKACPNCESIIHPACRICPDCGYEYPREDFEADKPDLIDADYGARPPVELAVEFMYPSVHVSKKNGRKLINLRLEMEGDRSGSLWLCLPGDGYTGFAVEKGKKLWKQLANNENYPQSAEELMERAPEMSMPMTAIVDLNGRYPEIKELKDVIPF